MSWLETRKKGAGSKNNAQPCVTMKSRGIHTFNESPIQTWASLLDKIPGWVRGERERGAVETKFLRGREKNKRSRIEARKNKKKRGHGTWDMGQGRGKTEMPWGKGGWREVRGAWCHTQRQNQTDKMTVHPSPPRSSLICIVLRSVLHGTEKSDPLIHSSERI